MVKLRIENTDFEAPEGSTILDVAMGAGFKIPTLCHKNGMPHYSSCMVCMVKDNKTNIFIPSCSALVQEGMDIDISGVEVLNLRRKAIEMLFAEHRAECEAPCRVVCPAGYNVPAMNRLITAHDLKGAIELCKREIQSSEILCTDCPGYCENACRRKKVDIPVSIRNLKLFIAHLITKNVPDTFVDDSGTGKTDQETSGKLNRADRPFTSRIGKLESSELQEWLKECGKEVTRNREISDMNSASGESQSCMHCDCRAIDDCRLRELAHDLKIKDKGEKLINSPIVKKINHNTGFIFENAKCIKCGLCVRLCEDSGEEPALCFIHRGFVSIISEPLTESFDSIIKTKSKEVIEICPTGALSKLK